jgi:hypothetical protein
MSTAREIEVRAAQARKWLDRAATIVAREMVRPNLVLLAGREVGAKRARKLRRAGHIVQFYRNNETGKARYKWMPKPFVFELS